MKPLALALAAAVLGTGCIFVDDTCSSNLALDWDFQLSDGAITGCAGADAPWVDVYVDGQFANSFSCTDGGATVWAPAGSAVTAEGIDADGRIAYRDWVTAGGGCGTRSAGMRLAEGAANLNYSVAGCSASPCYLWFSVYDETVGDYTAVIDSNSPALVKTTFPYPGDVVVRLPVGPYTLDWMELVSSSFRGEALTCGIPYATFDVAAGLQTDVAASLACAP